MASLNRSLSKMVRATGFAPAQSASQAEMLTVTSRPWWIYDLRYTIYESPGNPVFGFISVARKS